jgi:serine/threonine protein kinase
MIRTDTVTARDTSHAMRTSAQALSAGTQIDSFRIESVLGQGAFGITYRAADLALQRAVAIKEYFPSDLANRGDDHTTITPRHEQDAEAFEYGMRRFLDEARTLAIFDDPNIVRVTRFLEQNGTAYLVMEYEDGCSLLEVLQTRKHLDAQKSRAVAVHILRGLRALHTKNYLHRDVKPANIFIRKSGPPVLLDFGAARAAIEQKARGLTVMLTPGYAPLEQYSDEMEQGPWSDIYALGATLYHCLIGRPPLAATERVAYAHTRSTDPVGAALASALEDDNSTLADTILWMMAPTAEERPQSADDALAALLGKRDTKAGGRATTASFHTTTAPSQPATEEIPPELIARAELVLAEHLGPMATIFVEEASEVASGPEAFIEQLANELDDEERTTFIHKVKGKA